MVRDGQELLCLGGLRGCVDTETLRELPQISLVFRTQATRVFAAAVRVSGGAQAHHLARRKQIVLRKLSSRDFFGDLHPVHHPGHSLHDMGLVSPCTGAKCPDNMGGFPTPVAS